MNRWPDGALTRDEVSEAIDSGFRWRVEWCAGSRSPDASGVGAPLPDAVLERVPNGPKKRKLQRGLGDGKTWVFAFLEEDDHGRYLQLHEGPV